MTKATLKNAILPEGWAWTTVGEIASKIHYGHTASANVNPVGPKFLRITDIQNGAVSWESVPYCSVPPDDEPNYLLRVGDIVFARTGATVGKTFLIRGEIPKAIFASYLIRVVLDERLSSRFIYDYFQSGLYWNQIQEEKLGIGQPNVNASKLSQLAVPIPPASEQRRIADKLEELFSELDSAVASLKRVQLQLKRYRQSVLKHAVEGKLTAEWRQKHKGQIEPAPELLKRILAERRAKWEEQELAKMKASGKVPKDQSWKEKYKEPEPPNTEGLPELPGGWCWASLDQIASHEPNSITDGPFGSNLKTSHYTESGPRVVRLQNIASGQFVDERAHISPEHFVNLSKHRVFPGDIVLATLGKPLPRACLIPEWLGEAIVKADCIRLKVQHDLAVDKYVMLALNSLPIQSWAERIVHGVGRPRLNLEDVRSFPLPLPPRAEQEAVVLDVENKLSLTDEVQRAVETNLLRSGRLRDAVLRTAFSGRLVPQNPGDEPASVLLEIIRAEREKQATARKKVRSSPKAARTRRTRRKSEQHEGQAELFKVQD